MQPLIKWPGGKSKEFEYIKYLIPHHTRYVEPFFGGGAVFFQLKPKKEIINDINLELVNFYKFIKGEEDKNLLRRPCMIMSTIGKKSLNILPYLKIS